MDSKESLYAIQKERECARGEVHVNNCECRINLYKLWMRKFMGVNKYNLKAYSKTFEHVLSSRTSGKTREERFLRVLSC
jgi:transposase-like protein